MRGREWTVTWRGVVGRTSRELHDMGTTSLFYRATSEINLLPQKWLCPAPAHATLTCARCFDSLCFAHPGKPRRKLRHVYYHSLLACGPHGSPATRPLLGRDSESAMSFTLAVPSCSRLLRLSFHVACGSVRHVAPVYGCVHSDALSIRHGIVTVQLAPSLHGV